MRVTATLATTILALGCFCASEQSSWGQPAEIPPPATNEKRPPPTRAQLEQWAEQLDADSFETRQAAQENLAAAGAPAAAVVKKSLAGKSLEATERALQVLIKLGLADDFDTQDVSRTILDEVAAQGDTAVSRQAKAAILKMNERRGGLAVAELEKLGLTITRSQMVGLPGVLEQYVGIQIGPDWKGRDQDLRWLKWLAEVNRVVLVGEQFTDDQMASVAAMPGLKFLHLYRTRITASGLAKFADLRGLQELGVYYAPLDDEAIVTLGKFPALTSLKLYSTKITPAAKEKLRMALRLEKIDYRRGAFLGIGCDTLGEECIITMVHPNSPAEKAGIRRSDILVRFSGKPVPNFEGLTEIIADKTAGEKVEVDLLRRDVDSFGNQTEKAVKLQATLGEWDVKLFVTGGLRP